MKNLRLGILLLVVPLLFWQCTDESDEVSSSTLSGSAVKGPVVNADVTVYEFDAEGLRGDVLATTTTDQNGNFSVDVNVRGVVEVVISGGGYTDEASGQEVALSSNELRTIMTVDGDKNFGVTALTTIAAEYINENAEEGLAIAIENASKGVGEIFNLSDLDINTTIPGDLSSATSENLSMAQKKYGAVQAGLSQLLLQHEISPEMLPDLIEDIGKDFADGVIDGKNGSAALEFALQITPADALEGLQTAIENFMIGDNNKSGASFSDFVPGN